MRARPFFTRTATLDLIFHGHTGTRTCVVADEHTRALQICSSVCLLEEQNSKRILIKFTVGHEYHEERSGTGSRARDEKGTQSRGHVALCGRLCRITREIEVRSHRRSLRCAWHSGVKVILVFGMSTAERKKYTYFTGQFGTRKRCNPFAS